VLDEYRLGAHVADDAQGIDILLPASIDQQPRPTLAAKAEVEQLGVDDSYDQGADVGQHGDAVSVLEEPVEHRNPP
jgi:hypothetical protein